MRDEHREYFKIHRAGACPCAPEVGVVSPWHAEIAGGPFDGALACFDLRTQMPQIACVYDVPPYRFMLADGRQAVVMRDVTHFTG